MYKNKYIYICMMIFTYMYIISIGIYISYPASGFNTTVKSLMPKAKSKAKAKAKANQEKLPSIPPDSAKLPHMVLLNEWLTFISTDMIFDFNS